MPQGYGDLKGQTRSNPYRLRQDLGYVPMRAPADGDGGGGISYTGGPSGGVFSLTPIPTGKFLGNLTGADATPAATDFVFINLTDVPAAYTGAAGKLVSVNATEDGLEFTDPPTPPVTSTYLPLVNGGEPALLISNGGGQLVLVAVEL